jgi:hypothetical protein
MSMSPELQAVLSSAANFEMLVAQLLVPDNTARQQAEELFQDSKQHADACVSHLTQILRTSPSMEHKSFCAVMLRKVHAPLIGSLRRWSPLADLASQAAAPPLQVLTKEDPPVWAKASPNVQVGRASCCPADTTAGGRLKHCRHPRVGAPVGPPAAQ